MKKIGVVDYAPELATNFLFKKLVHEGYEVKFAYHLHELKKPNDFDALLMHPGTDYQKKAIEFAKNHPKIKVAIITGIGADETGCDYKTKEIPVLAYSSHKKIIDFIEKKKS